MPAPPHFPRLPMSPLYPLLNCTLAAGLLTGCAASPTLALPSSPDQPWQADAGVWRLPATPAAPAAPASPSARTYTIPAVPDLPAWKTDARYTQAQALELPQLIDIAQQENPSTRQAWNRAREAALSAGLTEALFLPLITASVVAGEQRLRMPVALPGNQGTVDVENKLRGTTPFLTLSWLLFDFGERDAIREGAQYTALAANILFNASHQKLIRDVTDAFYRYNAARANAALAQDALQQHQTVLAAVQARLDAGLATRIDLAVAQQALAQGRLRAVHHQGLERTSYLSLLDALGLPPTTPLKVAQPALDTLPSATAPLTQQRIDSVIAQRADIAAAYASVKVADAGKRTAQAAFLPKVVMAATWAQNRSNFQVGAIGGGNTQNATSGVLFGVSVPLYDGGLRSHQLSKLELARQQAQEKLEHLRMTAVREIVAAEHGLQTALQSHEAALQLVQTAKVLHDAALESYRVGRTSVVLLTESAIQLNQANQALAEAKYASVAAAANLAFVMGTMVSRDADWLPR